MVDKLKITLWYRFHEKPPHMAYNHLENGWSYEEKPIPKSDTQIKAWKGEWCKLHTYMIDSVVLRRE